MNTYQCLSKLGYSMDQDDLKPINFQSANLRDQCKSRTNFQTAQPYLPFQFISVILCIKVELQNLNLSHTLTSSAGNLFSSSYIISGWQRSTLEFWYLCFLCNVTKHWEQCFQPRLVPFRLKTKRIHVLTVFLVLFVSWWHLQHWLHLLKVFFAKASYLHSHVLALR